jgi:hypothetical protein
MMLALVLIVATDTAPTPVSAVPRSLSEYALRHPGLIRDAKTEPDKGAGGFSAAESTIPREPYVFVAEAAVSEMEPEPEPEPPEPEDVAVPPAYGPVWWGGVGGGRRTSVRMHPHPALHVAPRRLAPLSLARPVAPPAHHAHAARGGRGVWP